MNRLETYINPKELGFFPKDFRLEQQIANFFDISAERRFLENLKQKGVEFAQIAFYSREQVLKFLLEFAAGVKKTQIVYELNNQDKVVYPEIGLVMEDMLSKSAQSNLAGSRELSELLGWQRMQDLFAKNQADQVLQLSPPDPDNLHHGDYGFLFWFERKDKQVINHILRYDEHRQTLDQSQLLANQLKINYHSSGGVANSLIAGPQDFQLDSHTTEDLLKQLGFSVDNRGALLEQALLKDKAFVFWLARYQQLLSSDNFSQTRILEILSQLYQITQVKAELIGLAGRQSQTMPMPLIYMGGSCPIIQAGFSMYGYADYLYSEPFTCPSCGYVSWSPVGNQCPSCKMTKEKWAKLQKKKNSDYDICD